MDYTQPLPENPIYQAFLRERKIGSRLYRDNPSWSMYMAWHVAMHKELTNVDLAVNGPEV